VSTEQRPPTGQRWPLPPWPAPVIIRCAASSQRAICSGNSPFEHNYSACYSASRRLVLRYLRCPRRRHRTQRFAARAALVGPARYRGRRPPAADAHARSPR
jgi:hypothetical protein